MTRDLNGRAVQDDGEKRQEDAWYKRVYERAEEARHALIDTYEGGYERAAEWNGGRLDVVRAALESVRRQRSPEAAASMAY